MSHPADAWMPFLGDDFLESERVARLGPAERWVYLRLLWRQWKHGSLPDDVQSVAALVPDVAQALAECWGLLEPFFPLVDGRRVNPKCAELRAQALARSRLASAKGRKGGRKSQLNHSSTTAQPVLKPRSSSERTGEDSTGEKRRGEQKRAESTQIPPPAGAPAARSKRKPNPNKPPKDEKPTNPDHQPFIAWFTAAFEARYGFKYAFQGGHDARRVATILERTNLIAAQAAASAAFEDEWWGPKGVDLKTLLENLPKFQGVASTSLFGAPRRLSETEKATRQVLAAVRATGTNDGNA